MCYLCNIIIQVFCFPIKDLDTWYQNVEMKLGAIPDSSDRYTPTCEAIHQVQVSSHTPLEIVYMLTLYTLIIAGTQMIVYCSQ